MSYFKRQWRCGKRDRFIIMLILWVIGALLAILSPLIGLPQAFQLVMVGLGLGALLSWATAGIKDCPGVSGAPRFRRAHFFNEHPDKDATGIDIFHSPDIPGSPANPHIDDVPPGEVRPAPPPPEGFFYEGAKTLVVKFLVPRDGPGRPIPKEFTIAISDNPNYATDPALANHTAESLDVAIGPGPSPNEVHVSAVLLHREDTNVPDFMHTTFEGVL